MAFRFRCPACEELLSSREEQAGAEITCPLCEARIEVPPPPAARKRQTPPVPAKPPAKPPLPPQAKPAAGQQAADTASVEPAAAPLPSAAQQAVQSPIQFRLRQPLERDEMDMTPMVDVTFLLLIFFMITAAFSLQKSFELPAPDDSQPSTQARSVDDLLDDPNYVIVRIDAYNTFHISAAAWDVEQEAPSKQGLLDKLRFARSGAVSGPVPTHMLVMASEEAWHEKVVDVLDAGSAVAMEDVKLVTLPAE